MNDEFERLFRPTATHGERVRPGASAKGHDAPDEKEVLVGSTDYHPYGYRPGGAPDCDIQAWHKLRRDIPEGMSFDYRMLLRIGYGGLDVGGDAMFLRLFLPDCIIQIEGQHLHELRQKLRRREISFIQEFSELVFGMKASQLPAGEPVISSVWIGDPNDFAKRGAAH